MRVETSVAREHYAHPSQHSHGLTEKDIPEGLIHYAQGGVCLTFLPVFEPDIYEVHNGVKPEAWGHTIEPTVRNLAEFVRDFRPASVVAPIRTRNRLAIRLARQAGFSPSGVIGCLSIMELR